MSRKRRKAAATPPRDSGPSSVRPSTRRVWWYGAAALVLAIGAFALTQRGPGSAAPLAPFPPVETVATDTVALADFVGSNACAQCHQAAFASWSRSTHAAAGGDPGRVRLLAAFDGTPIRFRDGSVTPEQRGGRWQFVVRQTGRAEQVFRIDGVVGGGHMEGGGTQGFVSRMPDGTVRFLPWEMIRRENVWFCNSSTRLGKGWVPITPDMRMADCGDWPPNRLLGDDTRYANCQSCHGSQIDVRQDTVARAMRTSWVSLGINCESCHGPGRRHLALVADSAARASGDLGMAPLAVLQKDAALDVCFQCHSLKNRLQPGFRNGAALDASYSLHFPQLGDAPHLPDGRVRTFSYQQAHLFSDCYVNGGMTCTSCHDPHSQQYRDVQGRPLNGRFDDRQCTSCHAAKAANPAAHTHHAAESAGSRCVACHMPYLQEPDVGTSLRYARSDHAIPIPRPLADSVSGVTSACRGCHTDRTASELDRQTTAWYGEIKPASATIASVQRGLGERDAAKSASLLLLPDVPHTASQFVGLSTWVERHAAFDQHLPADAARRLKRMASEAPPDVRALALATLHYTEGADRSTRRFLIEQFEGLGATGQSLRARWVLGLSWFADRDRARGTPETAVRTYDRALELQPRNAAILLQRGLALADARDHAGAAASLRASLAIDAAQPLALVNLGIALAASGDAPGAAESYRRALAINAHEPLAHFNLANLQLQAGALDSAAAGYRAALRSDPALSLAHFYLARIQAQRGDLRAAVQSIDAGLEFDANNAEALAAREQLIRMASASR